MNLKEGIYIFMNITGCPNAGIDLDWKLFFLLTYFCWSVAIVANISLMFVTALGTERGPRSRWLMRRQHTGHLLNTTWQI